MLYAADDVMFSAGAVVFDTAGERVLTVVDMRSAEHKVHFPKGRVEAGETTEEAARREVEEEAGVVCCLWPKMMGVEVRESPAIGKTKVIYWYAASHVANSTQRLESHEQFSSKWVSIEDAAVLLSFEQDRRLLDICRAHLAI
ncbi:hypothetical protein GGI04_000811 [Coemansia thaxteri]|uniref:Nudix hydrolase domain-containing protein n=1 Tax=Coemansia thaxteri TaxID=2663907 RepID=A0A9W8BMI8_9FUNG|nr:hypothetical protein H4R26_001626 [Coemansia thaxteri]KAJ2009006.1 hypothetical protein GGI04_000811 [Coemansia thaxteri]KAJ2473238.1 hypothetical protein GGI02_001003 [Coemansia sp. RSA 2322]KAJ2485697.1 hypothetical protein EV174_001565 [Coemansia sp. RSA 2320]